VVQDQALPHQALPLQTLLLHQALSLQALLLHQALPLPLKDLMLQVLLGPEVIIQYWTVDLPGTQTTSYVATRFCNSCAPGEAVGPMRSWRWIWLRIVSLPLTNGQPVGGRCLMRLTIKPNSAAHIPERDHHPKLLILCCRGYGASILACPAKCGTRVPM
jgi:hypothetical protein